jgi:hypothetical protein
VSGIGWWSLTQPTKVRQAVDQSEGLKLDAYSAKAVSIPRPQTEDWH